MANAASRKGVSSSPKGIAALPEDLKGLIWLSGVDSKLETLTEIMAPH